ncbi:hypothetical protein NDI47_08055 [Microcoleus vaginatus GB1-A2]|uniref:hypothetical protein n=1 Tax=Microcoleus vaginatus TaxID=119532 RepID=UPI001683D9F5|nr:hypothetical protein [Microcoleus sp. FACHB-61]
MKNSTTGETNTGRDRASDVHRRPLTWQPPAFSSSVQSLARPRSNRPYLLRQGVLSQPSNLNLDAWKHSAGVFPPRLDIWLRYCCDTLLRAIGTFKTSIDLIDPAQKPIQAPDTRRGEIKILDPSSSSPIHLWSKSKI